MPARWATMDMRLSDKPCVGSLQPKRKTAPAIGFRGALDVDVDVDVDSLVGCVEDAGGHLALWRDRVGSRRPSRPS